MFSRPEGGLNNLDLIIGRADIFVGEIPAGSNTADEGFRHLGYVESAGVTPNVDNARFLGKNVGSGLGTVAKVTNTTASNEFNLEIASINLENLAIAFKASVETYNNAAYAGLSSTTLIADGKIKVGAYYPIKDGNNMPVCGMNKASVAVTTTETTPVVLVEGTDYELDQLSGIVKILATAKTAAAIAAGKGATVVVTANSNAEQTLKVVKAFSNRDVKFHVMIVQEDPETGARTTHHIPRCSLVAGQEIPLVSESEFMTFGFQGVAEVSSVYKTDYFVTGSQLTSPPAV